MLSTLAIKDTTKDAWDAIKTMRIGVECVILERLQQVAIFMKTLLDLSKISIEEVTDRLCAVEQRYKLSSSSGNGWQKLLLTEEEWLAYMKKHDGEGGSSSGGNGGSHHHHGKNHERDHDNRLRDGNTIMPGPRGGRDKCGNYKKFEHWTKDCHSKPKQAETYPTQGNDDEPTLLMAKACVASPATSTPWLVEAKIDSGIRGTIKFGNGSIVDIEGHSTILFTCKTGEHRVLMGVYFIPQLTTNIISSTSLMRTTARC
ncbi:uncharacterized protein LOC133927967 [Phragmites australis]|uniref:uncharacterized protein LOC133927967 n=1 Tax=Phragmites australis TaxID=29695 RepID=UPI002D79C09A|nr:uncharacterized protein LOC133927967 [Phragmites australis]